MRPLAVVTALAVFIGAVAGCGGSAKSPKLSQDGYAAAVLLAGLAAKQLAEARSEARVQLGTACAKVRTYADAEAKVMAQECARAESAGGGRAQASRDDRAPDRVVRALARGTAVDAQLASDLKQLAHAGKTRDQTGVSSAESALTALTRQAVPVEAQGVARIAACKPS